ncbi:MAG: peptide chain release factor N(5)-glutamine methyltransferase, partial [Dehalococcoidales bacterium]|nr:peptide chain release factor N(5)-glutamine methyltransferase [Dehalococcoidales bacterium]
EFYGTDFYVTPAVLIPRPETELLVEKAIDLIQKYHMTTIADIGTGCGAIAISLALRLSQIKIYATDISTSALEIALLNCERHGVMYRVCRLYGDMLDPLPGPVDLVIANLPYVSESELPEESPNSEPLLALNGGPDGLEPIRRLCHQVTDQLRPEGHLLLEIGHGQCQPVTSLLRHLFPAARIEITPDLGGIDRVVGLSRAPIMVTDAKR